VATALAVVRVGVGLALLLTPRLAQRVWLGPGRTAPRLTRALGARDLTLGALALRSPSTWVRAGATADAGDGLGHLLAGPRLSPRRRVLWGVGAGGMAALGWWAGARPA
jgi:hypothetical protein